MNLDGADLSELRAELQKRSLYVFLKAAWHVLEPGTPLVDNWHLKYVADHVQAVVARTPGSSTPKNLVVNVPPGTMKSLIVSVVLPAWVWLTRPSWRSIFASANPRVSLRDSMRCRDLVESEWYRKTFDVRWQLAEDQNAKGQYKLTTGGARLAISVGSKITGDRADALFIDDPHDANEVASKQQRESVLYWYDNAFANRVNSPEDSTRVLIMQRLHEEDLAGHVLAQNSWTHISLPMEYEPTDSVSFLGQRDPRTRAGELLMPARFSESVLADERRRLGSSGYAGQMQQRPVSASGNRFQRTWWRFWSPTPETKKRSQGAAHVPPRVINPSTQIFDEIIGSWDMAFKDTDGSDYVVGVVVGRVKADRFVLAMDRGRRSFSDSRRAVIQQKRDWPRIREILIEDKANGTAIIETLKSELTAIVAVNPLGGKEARAAAVEPEVEAGNWYLPDGAEWLGDFIDEFASFPLGSHDDIVDAISQAGIRFKNSDIASARRLLGIKL